MYGRNDRKFIAWVCLVLLSASMAHAVTPSWSERGALVRVITKWNSSCDSSNRSAWDNMVKAWYDDVTSYSEHGSAEWARDGFYKNGSIVDSDFIDDDEQSWGRDDWDDRVDEPDATFIATHGGNWNSRWYGKMRVDEAGDGDCYAVQQEMKLGNQDMEFLHMSSCFSMDSDDWVDWADSFHGLHQIQGFHGIMWISTAYNWRYREFSDDGFNTGMAISWVDNLYKYRAHSVNMCPVSMVAGHSNSNAWSRVNHERYNNVYSDPSPPQWFALTYILGCNPKDKGPLPSSIDEQPSAQAQGGVDDLFDFARNGAASGNSGSGGTGGPGEPGLEDLDRTVATRSTYLLQLDGALPTWDPSILVAPTGSDWIAAASVADIAAALGDTTPENIVVEGAKTVATDIADTKIIKIDTDEGHLRFVNRSRQFDYDNDIPRAWSESATQTMVFNAASQLGLPSSELDPTGGGMRVDTLGGRGYDAANPSPDGDEQLELERWLTIDRFVNGLPVFGSQVRGAVSNNGEIARLSARWPRFELESGLVLRSRQSVLDEVADHMWDAELGAAIEVEAQLVYTRAGDKFIPAALVSFSDPLSGEDLVVPLADVADIDLDGVEDALDNCPTTWNPEQRDDDADVEGNACDNCPDAFNPGQEDTFPADPDGVGDACAPIHHGCRLPDDTCEMLGFDDCNAEGGTSMGDDLTENLRFHSKSSIEWDADPSVDGPYALYRGNFDAGSWTYDHACHDESLATPSATDNATPASGTGYYFLSTVKDPCGESAPGASSSGDARPLDAPCP